MRWRSAEDAMEKRGGCDGEALRKLFEKSFPNPSKASRRQEKGTDGLGFKTVE